MPIQYSLVLHPQRGRSTRWQTERYRDRDAAAKGHRHKRGGFTRVGETTTAEGEAETAQTTHYHPRDVGSNSDSTDNQPLLEDTLGLCIIIIIIGIIIQIAAAVTAGYALHLS